MNHNRSDRTLRIVIAAMFAAMIAVMTAFVKFNTVGGYIHLGDSMIYLAASFLPLPYAVAAAALGGGIADLLTGYVDVAVYTVIIKALNALFFSSKSDRLLTRRNALMTIPSGLVTIVGYSISKFIRVLLAGGTMQVALVDAVRKIPENTVQAVGSAAIFILVAIALDRADIKKRMLRSL